MEWRLPERAWISGVERLQIETVAHHRDNEACNMVVRHEVVHARRQQQRLIDLPGAIMLAHGLSMGKTSALNDADLAEFVELQATFAESAKSWSVDVTSLDKATHDLSVKNPNGKAETALRDPQEIIAEMIALDAETADILEGIRGML